MSKDAVLLISTYSRSCGIATYAQDVVNGILATGTSCQVLSIEEDAKVQPLAPEVWARLAYDDRKAYTTLAMDIEKSHITTVAIQHEFGIFGGADGEWLLDLCEQTTKPIVTTLHTVLPLPSENQFRIIRAIAARSRHLVVLSEISRRILAEVYRISENVLVIPHGVPDVPFIQTSKAKLHFGLAGRPIVSTFGLISRGKGIEYAIEALRRVKPRIPNVFYIIAGRTHPKVLEQEGESYRTELQDLVRFHHLDENVLFMDKFLPLQELLQLLAATDVYATPYLNRDQVVSGTLAYAMGAGKAIISTPYRYAQELLDDQRGFLCDFRDSAAMAQQLITLLSDDSLRSRIEHRAYAYGRQMAWPQVSRQLAAIYAGEVPLHCSLVVS